MAKFSLPSHASFRHRHTDIRPHAADGKGQQAAAFDSVLTLEDIDQMRAPGILEKEKTI